MADKRLNIHVKTKGSKVAENSFKRLGSSISKTSSIITGIFGTALVAGAAKLSRAAAEAEGVRIAFNRLNKPGLLAELQKATKGTVADIELMKRAVSANNFRISLEQLPTLLKFAQQRARETGESVDYLVNSIVTGIGRKSVMILDNLGLSALEVREEFKKTGDMAVAVGNIIDREFAKSGEPVETLADSFDQTTASIQNISVVFGEFINNVGKTTGMFNLVNQSLKDWNAFLTDPGVSKEQSNRERRISELNAQILKYGGYVEKLNELQKNSPELFTEKRQQRLERYSAKLSGYNKQLSELINGEQSNKKVVTEADKAYSAFVLKQEEARAKAEQLTEFTLRYNEALARQNGLMWDVNIATGESVNLITGYGEKLDEVAVKATNLGDTYIEDVANQIGARNQALFSGVSSTLTGVLNHSQGVFVGIKDAFFDMVEQMLIKATVLSIFDAFLPGFSSSFGGGSFLSNILPFAKGGDFVTNGPQLIMVGDNPGGRERVQITPQSSPNINGPASSLTINFNGSITDERMVEEFIIPKISEAVRRAG